MGFVFIKAGVANPANTKKTSRVNFLVDSGSLYSVVPQRVLKRLEIKPESNITFTLANGQEVKRKVGNALFTYQRRRRASPVIFGNPGDSSLLGMVTLAALGFVLDPLRRELRPLL